MTLDEFAAVFNTEDDGADYLDTTSVPAALRTTGMPDLDAFLLLHSLLPDRQETDMISCAEHDQIWLNVDVHELARVASPDDIRNLKRLGVFFDEDTESLSLFV